MKLCTFFNWPHVHIFIFFFLSRTLMKGVWYFFTKLIVLSSVKDNCIEGLKNFDSVISFSNFDFVFWIFPWALEKITIHLPFFDATAPIIAGMAIHNKVEINPRQVFFIILCLVKMHVFFICQLLKLFIVRWY